MDRLAVQQVYHGDDLHVGESTAAGVGAGRTDRS
jgi:hypothetical protein